MAVTKGYMERENKDMLIYPKTPEHLGDYNAFIKITSYEYNNMLYASNSEIYDSEKNTDKNILLKNIKNQIFLPIPNEGLNISDSIDYETVKGGASLPRKFLTLLIEGLRTNFGPFAAYEDVMKSTTGGAINNFMANLFNGMTLREFTFSWDFIPYSQEDAMILKTIINNIRKRGLPTYDNNSLGIKFPDFWVVEPYINEKLLYELNFLVLTDINISYDNPEGTSFFHDGQPVKTKLVLKFKEVYPAGAEIVDRFEGK